MAETGRSSHRQGRDGLDQVIEPTLVDVMRSCRRPISSASVGW